MYVNYFACALVELTSQTTLKYQQKGPTFQL